MVGPYGRTEGTTCHLPPFATRNPRAPFCQRQGGGGGGGEDENEDEDEDQDGLRCHTAGFCGYSRAH